MNMISHDVRTISHDVRTISHDVRMISHDVRTISHDVRMISHGVHSYVDTFHTHKTYMDTVTYLRTWYPCAHQLHINRILCMHACMSHEGASC